MSRASYLFIARSIQRFAIDANAEWGGEGELSKAGEAWARINCRSNRIAFRRRREKIIHSETRIPLEIGEKS